MVRLGFLLDLCILPITMGESSQVFSTQNYLPHDHFRFRDWELDLRCRPEQHDSHHWTSDSRGGWRGHRIRSLYPDCSQCTTKPKTCFYRTFGCDLRNCVGNRAPFRRCLYRQINVAMVLLYQFTHRWSSICDNLLELHRP